MNRRDLIKIGATAASVPVQGQPTAAFSPKFFDAHQNETVVALTGLTLNTHAVPFIKCSKPQQIAILADLDKSNQGFFRQAKTMTSRIYYATSAGYQELNKGGRVPSSFGCKHPEYA